jgi:hypothetical protein
MKVPNFKVWFYDYSNYIIGYDYENKTFDRVEKPYEDINSFYLASTFQNTEYKKEMTEEEYEEHLKKRCIEYANLLVEWAKEIYNYKGLKKRFDYFDNSFKLDKKDNRIYYRNHASNIITFFKMLCKKNREIIYKDYDKVYFKEYNWFRKCKNGGLQYLKAKGIYKNTVGYDSKMSYPTDMGSVKFRMPTKEGKERYIKELPKNAKHLSYGIYRVKIECDDPNFDMVFTKNDKHYYTHYSLGYAMSMKTRKLFKNLEINLIIDEKPNAYTYNSKDLVQGNEVFGNWYKILKQMKTDMPKNGLIKMLASSGWGHLNAVQDFVVSEEKLEEMAEEGKTFCFYDDEDYDNHDYVIIDGTQKETELYTLINLKKPVYDMPLRLLPFITSFSRAKMGRVITSPKHILFDKVIRIHTDGICFNEDPKLNIEGFIKDDKISGDIEFENINTYHKIKPCENKCDKPNNYKFGKSKN